MKISRTPRSFRTAQPRAHHPPSDVVTRLRDAGCVFAEDEARLLVDAAPTSADLAAMVERRASGLPLEHLLGWAEFHGLRIAVDVGVFVPRRRTEFLARLAIEVITHRDPTGSPPVVVDLCCGSGAVGAAVLASVPDARLYGTDIDAAAVRCARCNIGGRGRAYAGDLYRPLPTGLRGGVDVVVVNAPYVPSDAVGLMPPEARIHEPQVALDGGADGLDIQRRVGAEALSWLAPGGHLLIETGEHQAERTAGMLAEHGLLPRVRHSDDLDATVALGTKPRPRPRGAGSTPR